MAAKNLSSKDARMDRSVLCVLETLICQLRSPPPHARKAIALGLAASREHLTNYLPTIGAVELGIVKVI